MPDHVLPTLPPIDLGGDFKLDLSYYLTATYDDIGQASSELPAIIEWVNMKLQEMVESRLIKKQEIKEVEAEAYFYLKDGAFVRDYNDKMTESSLSMAVALSPKVKQTHHDFAVLSGWVERLSNLQGSLSAKLDLTRSSEATRRQLINTNHDTDAD